MKTVIDEINKELKSYSYGNFDRFINFLQSLMEKYNFEKEADSRFKHPSYFSIENDMVIFFHESDLIELRSKIHNNNCQYALLREDENFKSMARAQDYHEDYSFYRLDYIEKESTI